MLKLFISNVCCEDANADLLVYEGIFDCTWFCIAKFGRSMCIKLENSQHSMSLALFFFSGIEIGCTTTKSLSAGLRTFTLNICPLQALPPTPGQLTINSIRVEMS